MSTTDIILHPAFLAAVASIGAVLGFALYLTRHNSR